MLTLPIKRKWFDMILAGEKTEEYRANTAYWRKRLLRASVIQRLNPEMGQNGLRLLLRNGYRKDAPSAVIELSGVTLGKGRTEWGAEPGVNYLRLHIRKVERLKCHGNT